MYILKNAVRNITRQIGRNILIGSIILVIAIASCVTLTINNSGKALIENYKATNPLEVSLKLDPMQFRKNGGDFENFEVLDLETANSIPLSESGFNINSIESKFYMEKVEQLKQHFYLFLQDLKKQKMDKYYLMSKILIT